MTEEQQVTTEQTSETSQSQTDTETTEGTKSEETTEQDSGKTYDEDYVKQLRSEAAGYRTELRKLQKDQKSRDDAEKSELEKANSELEELRTEREKWQRERTANAFRSQIGLPSPGLALGAARELGVEVELDDSGNVKNLDAIRKQLKKEYPREFGDGSADGSTTGAKPQANDMNAMLRAAAGRG